MSALFEQPRNAGTLFLGGQKISGQDIRDQNVLATQYETRNITYRNDEKLITPLEPLQMSSNPPLVHRDSTR
jgi:hypothetical protein